MRFEKMKVQSRLMILSLLAFLGLIILTTAMLAGIRSSAMASHRLRISHLVESAASMVNAYQQQVSAGKLSTEEAQKQAATALKAMRFGEDDYFFVYNFDGVMVAHGTNPKLEGQSQLGKPDAAGKLFRDEIVKRGKAEGSGYVDYVYPRATGKDPEPKLTYFRSMPAWNWIICSAVYVDDVAQEVRSGMLYYGSISVILLVLVLASSWWISRGITRQLGGEPGELMTIMARAAQGDLRYTTKHEVPRHSVLASLGEMLDGLSRLVREIGASSSRLASASTQVAGSARSISQAAGNQSESTSAMAAAMEEMTVAIAHIAESARTTEARTLEASELAHAGEEGAEQAKKVIGEISATVEQASTQVGDLVKRTQEINTISAVIKEIAAQTNLLALNASIEAARAGEQGRGFAVVADEVRSLAERTAQATVQIEGMVKTIQDETSEVVVVMNAAVPQAKQGVALAQAAASTLGQMREGALQSLAMVRDVAESTREQSLASTSIAQQVEKIARVIEETSASAESSASTAGELESLSSSMQRMVEHFVTR